MNRPDPMMSRDFLAAVRNGESLEALSRCWDRAFLNYTPSAPGRWRDPDEVYTGDLDTPVYAAAFLERLLIAEPADRRTYDRIFAYLQFYAAVWRQNYNSPADRGVVRRLISAVKDAMPEPSGEWLDDLSAQLEMQ